MSILLDGDTPVVVQGITGRQAARDVEHALAYGTDVVAGVRPGKGGTTTDHGVPVYDTVDAAVAEHGAGLSVAYLPAAAVEDGVMEAFHAGVETVVLITESVPKHDVLALKRAAAEHDARLVGPGSNGVSTAGEAKVGGHGGDDPSRVFEPGRVGIVSRSGGLSTEIAWLLKRAGLGVSSVASIGGGPYVGSTLADVTALFEADADTDVVVICGEAGTRQEEAVAAQLRDGTVTTPVVAVVSGEFMERLPTGVSFGHTGSVIGESSGSPSAKQAALEAAGALVADTLDDLPDLVAEAREG